MYQSWGQYPVVEQIVKPLRWRNDRLPSDSSLLPYGQGRSYGDVCLNDQGVIVSTAALNHFIDFAANNGVLRCESGVTLAEILQLVVPQGWFLSVTPGTKFVSIGGAIANDVHGKNHHRAGTFGCHVRKFELLRSDGSRTICSPSENTNLFRATIGGLGLTGLITWAEIQLKAIDGPFLQTETIRLGSLSDFIHLSEQSDHQYEYTVAWLDTSVAQRQIGRGLFMRGNHAKTDKHPTSQDFYHDPLITVPFNAPNNLISIPVIKLFNRMYYHRPIKAKALTGYNAFFYPLDLVQYWNRLYGRRGFQSYQCIVPRPEGLPVIREMLSAIHQTGLASPLTVLKIFGNIPSPGILSFPRPGINLLLDFPNVGRRLDQLLLQLDRITCEHGGRVNPAKDAHLSPDTFQAFFPEWQTFSEYIDPHFSSSFWRRVAKGS